MVNPLHGIILKSCEMKGIKEVVGNKNRLIGGKP
jgi:hypothetical protein